MAMRRVQVQWTGTPGAPYFTNMYFDAATSTAVAAAGAVDTFMSAIDGVLDSDIAWTRQPDIATIDEVSGDLTGLESVASTSGVGSVVGETAPSLLQALVRWRTEVPFNARLLQGRTFIPGLGEGALANGVLAVSVQTALQDAANALIANVNAALVVWRRPVPPPEPPATEPPQRDGAFAHVVVSIVPTQFSYLRTRRD